MLGVGNVVITSSETLIKKKEKGEERGKKKNDIRLTGSKIDSDRKLQSYTVPVYVQDDISFY